MKEAIGLIFGVLLAFPGWGWPMSRRWVILTFRTLTFECVLVIILLLTFNWIKVHPQFVYGAFLFVIPPLFFFWEIIPFPIIEINQPKNKFIPIPNKKHIQFFKQDGITTIRIQTLGADPSGIGALRSMKHNPERFIYPYINGIDISPILNGQNYLSIRYCLFSSLPYEYELSKVKVHLIINGIQSYSQQKIVEYDSMSGKNRIKHSLRLWAENPNETAGLRIYLPKQGQDEVLKFYKQNMTVSSSLSVTGLDVMNNYCNLQTNLKDFALLNGRKLYKNDTR